MGKPEQVGEVAASRFSQSIIDNRDSKETIQSIIDYRLDSRVRNLHSDLCRILGDSNYGIGHTYKIVKGGFSDADAINAAEYCHQKSNNPGAGFVGIWKKKFNRV